MGTPAGQRRRRPQSECHRVRALPCPAGFAVARGPFNITGGAPPAHGIKIKMSHPMRENRANFHSMPSNDSYGCTQQRWSTYR
jgi:hypothetical protein